MHAVPLMVAITSNLPSPITEGASVTLTCMMEIGALMIETDLQLFGSLFKDEVILINGTTVTYTHQIGSFNRTDSGNYSCTATARPHSSSVFINVSDAMSDVLRVTTGKGKKYSILYL